ncbi:MAG: tetratricopeptide repeat protein [Anaerolineae bacterium]
MNTPNDAIFVGRAGELQQLYTLLERTLDGQGQVAFVTGEAGSGKTALTHQFCRQAQAAHAELVVALGQCDAQTGAGTPYLPFAEVIQLLTGDVVEGAAAETLSEENASRLKSVVRFSRDTLLAFGPDLIDVLVPGSGLVITASTFIAEQTGLSGWVQKRIKRDQPSAGITQENIFEQYSNVIRRLAESQPLILVLDDLHWADAASCELLFRLGRRIEDRPCLILGTYRPNDVAAGRDGARHPLEPVAAELTRYFGNVRVDLDREPKGPDAEDGAYEFVSAYVDQAYSPHTLGSDFLHLIAERTDGHPLFVVELLRDLEERGWLAHEVDVGWRLTQPVTFNALPPRVEGIIEERIGRLDPDAQEMLTIAAVEGDEFIAQVVAQVQRLDEREVVRRLSRELDRQHQLVVERGVERLGRQRLYLFAFRHILFQTHLYQALGDIDRSLLHEDVGTVLEDLYAERAADIAVPLSYHFLEAGLEERALPYLIEAGDQARRAYANQQAVDYYGRALAIIDEMLGEALAGELTALQQMQFDVLGRREEVYDRLGKRDEQAAGLEQMLALAGRLGEQQQAEAYNRQSHYFWAISDYDQAVEAASRALPLVQAAGDRLGEGEARRNLGRAARGTGDYGTAFEHFQAAAELFDAAGAKQQEADALIQIGTLHSHLGQWQDALHHLQDALEISREIGGKWEQAFALDNIGIVYACEGDYSQALHYSQKALTLAQAIGSQFRALHNLINLGLITAYLGDYEQAVVSVEEALRISRAIQNQSGEASALINLGSFHQAAGRFDEALSQLEAAIDLALQIKNVSLVAECHYVLAVTYQQRSRPGDPDQAIEHALKAIATAEQAGLDHYHVLGHSWLAMGYLAQGKVAEALAASTSAVERLEEIGAIEGAEEAVYYNHFQVLQVAGQAVAARQALQQAQQIVRDKAEQISDSALQQSFLEKVPLNRQILRAATDQG